MRVGNLLSQASRVSDVGLVWKLLNNGTADTQEIAKYSAIYVKAKAACVVTLDGEDSISLDANDTVVINVGPGKAKDNKKTVKVEFSGIVICCSAEEKNRQS